jgi:hypothetical protein
VLLLVIVFAARSCGGNGAETANKNYFDKVSQVVRTSDSAGTLLHRTLRSRPMQLPRVEKRLRTALARARQASSNAAGLEPTSQVRQYQPALEIAMGYRVNGLKCLVDNMPAAWRKRRPATAGRALVQCMQRLVASDVVYADSFANPSTQALSKAGLQVQVPQSTVLAASDQDLLTTKGIGVAVRGLHPAVARSGLHGLALDSVVVEPGGKALQPGSTPNQVKASDNLAFVVSATNGGHFQEVDIPVVITLVGGNQTLKGQGRIDRIGAGQRVSVRIGGIVTAANAPSFGRAYKMMVKVVPVPGERTATNNVATYTIVFTL